MTTMLPYMHARGPQYWLTVDPTLDSDNIPHAMEALYPGYLVNVDVEPDTPLDAVSGEPGDWLPQGTNFADLAAAGASLDCGDGIGPSAGDMDTQGHYIVLGDASECHYRLGVWTVGRVP